MPVTMEGKEFTFAHCIEIDGLIIEYKKTFICIISKCLLRAYSVYYISVFAQYPLRTRLHLNESHRAVSQKSNALYWKTSIHEKTQRALYTMTPEPKCQIQKKEETNANAVHPPFSIRYHQGIYPYQIPPNKPTIKASIPPKI